MQTQDRIVRTLRNMHARCYNPKHPKYCYYGERGITICDEWRFDCVGRHQAYDNFMKWALANGYDDSLSIDRIDNNGNYCPENCRWATAVQQRANQRSASPRNGRRKGKTSQFLGVSWDRDKGRWRAALGIGGRALHIGLYRDEFDAALAYDAFVKEHFAERGINWRTPEEAEVARKSYIPTDASRLRPKWGRDCVPLDLGELGTPIFVCM